MSALAPAATLSGFDLFWARYPNKAGYHQAKAVWDDLEPSAREQDAILSVLAKQEVDDFRVLIAGGTVQTPVASVWLYTRHLRQNAPGRACADWRIALEEHRSGSPSAALALHATLWLAGVACFLAMAAAPELFDRNDHPSAAVADAIADAHRVARFERVSP